ncbi:hypothetical protein EWB00_009804 [Schistosoma japonicum]|uniref:Uncharacterized protein n=1 Tax=Schistosoma japonicum TaxID=6182 RepID=A0A4Z2DQI4_SCHJA|nr:hypothetical protein EWB00_009804 [Schistosoma japonicum]
MTLETTKHTVRDIKKDGHADTTDNLALTLMAIELAKPQKSITVFTTPVNESLMISQEDVLNGLGSLDASFITFVIRFAFFKRGQDYAVDRSRNNNKQT